MAGVISRKLTGFLSRVLDSAPFLPFKRPLFTYIGICILFLLLSQLCQNQHRNQLTDQLTKIVAGYCLIFLLSAANRGENPSERGKIQGGKGGDTDGSVNIH